MSVRPLLLLAATLFLLHLPARPAEAQDRLAITSVNIVDVAHGSVHRDQTVLVEGDRIAVVGDADEVEIPAGAAVIDGSGKYVIPGLWDMHVHTTTDRNTREIIFPLLVAHGVTGIRSMAADCFETGVPNCEEEGSAATLATIEDVRRWRSETESGDLVGPRVVAGSYYVNSPSAGELSTAQYPRTAEHGRAHARLLHERGVDFVKIYDMLSPEAYFALAEEANRLGLPFDGHVPVAVRASEASDAGQRSIEHLGAGNVLEECSSREDELRQRLIYTFHSAEMGARHTPEGPSILNLMLEMIGSHDPQECAALAERFVRNGTWVTPTLMVARLPSELGVGWREDPYARFLPSDERRYFEWAQETYARDMGDPPAREPYSRWVREVTETFHRAGVPMLAGSDAGETGIFWGISLHQELELLVSAGLTEAEALRAATLAPAAFLEATASLGTVEPGKVADLVLLEANPLEDITNTQRIAAVVLRGRYLDREALDGLLADAERAASRSREALNPEGLPLGEEVQEAEIPRTPTFPGLQEAPYPYVAPADVGLSAERLQRLGDQVAEWVRDSLIVGGEILIVKDRKIAFHESIGWSDRKADEPMARNTIYRLRSMTKPFTGTAALMLVEEGKLALDAPVARWLPSWDNDRSGEVTVRQLLTHTGGWVQDGLPTEPVGTYPRLRAAVDAAGEAGPQHPPGEAYRYSDVHSYTLGALVAEVSGMPVEQFIEERILEPLGLDDTHTRFAPDTAWAERMNPTYRREDGVWEQYWHPDSAQVTPFFRASGGMYSTVFDYARWMDVWMRWTGLIEPPAEEATAPRLLSEDLAREAVTPSPLGAYGYHWGIRSPEPLVFEHGGSDGTLATAIPSRNTIVLYFTQSRGNQTRGEWNNAMFDAVAPTLEFPRPTPSLPAADADLNPVELPLEELERYAGAYDFLGDTLTVAMEGGQLRVREPWGPRVTLDGRPVPGLTLVPVGDRTFAFGRYEGGELLEVYLPTLRFRFEVQEGQIVGFRPIEGSGVGPLVPKIR